MCEHKKGLIEDREELEGQLKGQLKNILNGIKISGGPEVVDNSIEVAVNRIVLLISTMLRQERLKQNERTL